jgi:hypothetical protein
MIEPHLRLAIRVFLDEGYEPKWIMLKLRVSKNTVYRAHPERFKTGVFPRSRREGGKNSPS